MRSNIPACWVTSPCPASDSGSFAACVSGIGRRVSASLTRAGWNRGDAPVFIQSFETANLRYLRTKAKIKLIQLIDADDVNLDGTLAFNAPFDRPYDWTVSGRKDLFSYLVTPRGLAEVATYADGIGPWKRYIVSTTGTGTDLNGDGKVNEADTRITPATTVVTDAHRAGLLVHPYTFRNEQRRLAADYKGNPVNEYLQFYELGVDGLFSDFADTAFAARIMFNLSRDKNFAKCLVGSSEQRQCGKGD